MSRCVKYKNRNVHILISISSESFVSNFGYDFGLYDDIEICERRLL